MFIPPKHLLLEKKRMETCLGTTLVIWINNPIFWGQGVKLLVPSYRDSNKTPFSCWKHWSVRLQKSAVGCLLPFRSLVEGYYCAVCNFWTKTDRGLIFLAKLVYFMCFSTLLLRWRLKNNYFELHISDYEILENPPKWGKIPKDGTFHSASQSKEGNLVLALPTIRFAWNFHQIISGTKYE